MDLVSLEVILMIVLGVLTAICGYLNILLYQKKYAQHVVFDSAPKKLQKRLLDHSYIYFLGYLAFVIFCSWYFATLIEGDMQQFFFGILISMYAMLLGRIIGGMLICLYAIKNPEKIAGQTIFEDKRFKILHKQHAIMPCLILLGSLCIIQFTPFIFGCLVSVMIDSLVFFLMLLKN